MKFPEFHRDVCVFSSSGVVEDIFKIASIAPGAMLYEASREFQKGSQRADEYIRLIKDKLDVAVEQCIQAAGEEYEAATQKMLLRVRNIHYWCQVKM